MKKSFETNSNKICQNTCVQFAFVLSYELYVPVSIIADVPESLQSWCGNEDGIGSIAEIRRCHYHQLCQKN